MKKKLAVFTAAVGFFTICNVILYTRKLRTDEMISLWHWTPQPIHNCSSLLMLTVYEASVCGNGSHSGGPPVGDVKSEVNATNASLARSTSLSASFKHHLFSIVKKHAMDSSGYFAAVLRFPKVSPLNLPTKPTSSASGSNSTALSESVKLDKSSSLSSTSFFMMIQNRTYHVDMDNATSVSTPVLLTGQNRTVRLCFNKAMLSHYGISIQHPFELTTPTSTITTPNTIPNPVELSPPTTTYHPSSSNHPALTELNKHQFDYLINAPNICGGAPASNLTLIVLVATAVNHFAQRKAIRETWGSMATTRPDLRLAFVMGRPTDPTVEPAIINEALQHADIIQEDFMDTYKNLTLKTVMLLKWVSTFCPATRYVMKSDDDMFINLYNLLKYIRNLHHHKGQLFGRLVKGARPLRSRNSKYYVPVSEYKERVYPDYLSGTAYVMSTDVASKLFRASQSIPIFFFEDVFITGICAKKAGIVRRNHSGFVYYKRPVRGCVYNRVISGHNNSPADLRKIWKDFERKNFKC